MRNNPAIKFFSSLELTVACLGMAMVLVFTGTLAQVHEGLYLAQANFFHSLFVFWTPNGTHWKIPVWPGGYLLGGVLLANLIVAHFSRFKLTRKKIGIFLVHGGLILLFLGQFMTDLFARESQMVLAEGETKNYSESDRRSELVLIDKSMADRDRVVAIPEGRLKPGREIQAAGFPFIVRVKEFYPNSRLGKRPPFAATAPPPAERGIGLNLEVNPAPITVKTDERNVPSAVVEIVSPQGTLGTWLVSDFLDEPQRFSFGGRIYELALRWARYYKPYSIQLEHFTHARYLGTDIDKDFASLVRLRRNATGEDREIKIYMNNPLRYNGETYYQSGFKPGDTVTILQVVRNPSWLTPYVSVALIGLGLVTQFFSHLLKFAKRRVA